MSYYPREIVDCYLDKKFEELLNVSGAEAVYVASVAKDLNNDKFYIERGIHYKGIGTKTQPITIDMSACIEEYNEKRQEKNKIAFIPNEDSLVEPKEVGIFKLQCGNKYIRPAIGGCGIGYNYYKSGTMGALLLCKEIEDTKLLITNYHVVFDSPNFVRDKLIFQPSPSDGDMDYCNIIGKVQYGHFGKYVDVALVEIVDDKLVGTGTLSDKNPIKGIDTPKINDLIFKTGASSCVEKGVIRSTNTYVKFKSPWKSSKYEILEKQILSTNISKDGDSGSIIINENTGKAVGLLIGGDDLTFSIHNNFEYIFNKKYNKNYKNMKNIEFFKFL